jgi:hypothetical protein
MQTMFFFGYNAIACYAFFLMLGTIGWWSSHVFVFRIFQAVKVRGGPMHAGRRAGFAGGLPGMRTMQARVVRVASEGRPRVLCPGSCRCQIEGTCVPAVCYPCYHPTALATPPACPLLTVLAATQVE